MREPGTVGRRRVFAATAAVALVVSVASGVFVADDSRLEAQELEIPGPEFPVGPTDWDALVDVPGPVTISSGTHVIENVRYLSGLTVVGSSTDVTLRNCVVVHPGSFWTVLVEDGAHLTMEDCQIGEETGDAGERGIGVANVTLRRVKIIGHEDGIKAGENSLYEQVWIMDLRGRDSNPDPHVDGIQDDGGHGDWVLRYSRVEPEPEPGGWTTTSAVLIKSDLGPIDNVLLEHNILNNGAYTVYSVKGDSYPSPTNVSVLNNAFGHDYGFGIFTEDEGADPVTWEGNYWVDTGECIDNGGHVIGGSCGPASPPPTTTQPPPTTAPPTTTEPPTTTQPPPTTAPPGGVEPYAGSFSDDDGNIHEPMIEAIYAADITRGCNPPANDRYCPDQPVTRAQMAAFMARAFGLSAMGPGFIDTVDSIFATDIARIQASGITRGCNPPLNDRYCPGYPVTRAQMAAFLVRHFLWTDDGGGNLFIDDDDSIFEADIDRLRTAGVTQGCNPPLNNEYCPNEPVRRDQMASFLARALGLDPISP